MYPGLPAPGRDAMITPGNHFRGKIYGVIFTQQSRELKI
jgi:hypothetical protein